MVEGYSCDAQGITKLNALKELATRQNSEVKLELEVTQEQLVALGIKVPANDNGAGNTPLTIVDILRDNTPRRLYNFEVKSLSGELTHNYLVGEDLAWVHNADSPGRMDRDIKRGWVTRAVLRADTPKIEHEKPHVHLDLEKGGSCALNSDGTWKHKPKGNWKLPKKIIKRLRSRGWSAPQ